MQGPTMCGSMAAALPRSYGLRTQLRRDLQKEGEKEEKKERKKTSTTPSCSGNRRPQTKRTFYTLDK